MGMFNLDNPMAIIHSKGGKLGEIEVLEKRGQGDYIVRVVETGVRCTAIFNCFVGRYYADDVYGIVKE